MYRGNSNESFDILAPSAVRNVTERYGERYGAVRSGTERYGAGPTYKFRPLKSTTGTPVIFIWE